ncbi:Putative ribonuclease H protein At1g65750, partial [Linum perenne]
TTNATYQHILDRMDSKLSGWKAKSLSLAGRVTLAQAILSAIPAYAMQTSLLPATTCSEIDKRICDFIWGSSANERKTHLISWDKISLPKEQGGLGLRSARVLNRAYMTKLAFLFLKDEEPLWIRVPHIKYFKKTSDGLRPRHTSSRSAVWKGISAEWNTMLRGSSGSSLLEFSSLDRDDINLEEIVADFVDATGNWNISKLEACLNQEGINVVMGMSPPNKDRGEDGWAWGAEPNGKFSIKSAYNLLAGEEAVPRDLQELWMKTWKWRGPNRVKHFLWLAGHDRLLTNEERVKRKVTTNPDCPLCPGLSLLPRTGMGGLWGVLTKRQRVDIAWESGPSGWSTINTDGAFDRISGRAAAGGLIRNELGHCAAAFTMNIGCCTIMRAELRGAIAGLRCVWDLGLRKVELQVDSNEVIDLFNDNGTPTHHHAMEVLDFQELCKRDWEIRTCHVFREGNRATDFLAGLGSSYPLGTHSISVADARLGLHLRYDCMGISEPRLIFLND